MNYLNEYSALHLSRYRQRDLERERELYLRQRHIREARSRLSRTRLGKLRLLLLYL
jgi:hypothetical protein